MKVCLLMEDAQLFERAASLETDTEWQTRLQAHWSPSPEEALEASQPGSFDAWIISDRYFQLLELQNFVEELLAKLQAGEGSRKEKEHPRRRLLILLSNRHDNEETQSFIKYCAGHNLAFIYPGRSEAALLEEMYRFLHAERQHGFHNGRSATGKILLFVGTTPNIGTTVASFGTAVQLCMQSDKSVLYMCLNLKSSKLHRYLGMDHPSMSLDTIRPELKSRSLSAEQLMRAAAQLKGVHRLKVLFGNLIREQAEFYTPEDVHYLLDTGSKLFDVCIVEVNAYWDNAATVSGMLKADAKVLVTTPQLSHFQEDTDRWLKNFAEVFDISLGGFDVLITQSSRSDGAGMALRDIRKELKMPIIGTMQKLDAVPLYLNQGRLMELATTHEPFLDDLQGIVSAYAAQFHIDLKPKTKERPWLKRAISSFIGVG